jgi:hypothetical protein
MTEDERLERPGVVIGHDATLAVVQHVVRGLIDAIGEQDGFEPQDADDIEVKVLGHLNDVLDIIDPLDPTGP